MLKGKNYVLFVGIALVVCSMLPLSANEDDTDAPLLDGEVCQYVIRKYKQKSEPICFCELPKGDKLGYNIVKDVVGLIANLFHWDTIKILVGLFPAFIGARMIDEKIQNNFFCHAHHKNINQLPRWCCDIVPWTLAAPIVLLGSQAFISKDPEMRYAGWMLLLGIPFVIFGKDTIKQFDAECCLRPWHEDFCKKKHKRCLGGFPSGHMSEATYMAVLYGVRFGPAFGIPLGAYAAALGLLFINCNRHYTSQIVAGAALGTIFALAASKVIDRKLNEYWSLNLSCDSQGSPCLGVSCTF